MAIDFSQVKEIVIPEGNVKKIEINGITVWKLNTKALLSIAISGATTTFNVGNTWVFGGTVTATYSDGTTADVTADTTFSGYNMSTAGTQTVTATYVESGVTATATYNITVYKVLTSISLSGQTTSLNRDAAFSFGGTVTAHYNDNSTANVTSSTTFSGYNMSTAGTYTVTASYTYRSVTKTATYKLTVNKAWTAIWSGNKSMTIAANTSTDPSAIIFYTPASNYPNTSDIRITFTMSNKSGTGGYYFTYDNVKGSTKPSSPYRVSSFDKTKLISTIVGVSSASSTAVTGHKVSIQWYKPSGSTGYFRLSGITSNSSAPGALTVTVTKIERYY